MTSRLDSAYGAFILRVALGLMFVAHGALKVFVFTIPGTVGYFAGLGLPAVAAYATIAAEIVGGLALVAGVFVRPVAAALVPVLLGALFLAHADKGWVFSNPGGGWEYPAFLAAAALAQVFLGAGAFALKPEAPVRLASVPAE